MFLKIFRKGTNYTLSTFLRLKRHFRVKGFCDDPPNLLALYLLVITFSTLKRCLGYEKVIYIFGNGTDHIFEE